MDDLFPSLAGQGMISFDCETRDPLLRTQGSGWHRGPEDFHVAGVSVATEAGFWRYYPVGHEGGGNLDRKKVVTWLREQLALPVPKVGARLVYDLGCLASLGVTGVQGPFYDVQVAEPLLFEDRFKYDLDSIMQYHLGVGKKATLMDELLVRLYGRKNPRGSIWRLPGDQPELLDYVRPDAVAPLEVFKKQRDLLVKDDLWDLFLLESRLIPMLVAMRRRGVRVDLGRAERLYEEHTKTQSALQERLGGASVWAARELAPLFEAEGVPLGRTPTGLPSITALFLEQCQHPLAALVLEIRRLDKLRGTFLKGGILESHYKGRVHCDFNQLKGEGGGAVSGRFSSSSPNLQFIPSRTEQGKEMRRMFLPDEGDDWEKQDESQIEFRLMVHDAAALRLRGAEEIARMYREDPKTDFHVVVEEIVFKTKGVKANRRRSKNINFGIAFGEGAAKLAATLGFDTVEEGVELIEEYHRKIPFMRALSRHLMAQAAGPGLVRTLLGRKRRYDRWEVTKWDRETGAKKTAILPHRVAGAKRAFTYKAIADRIQGSAADVIKKAMVDVWESGVCSVLGPPLVTVHDELGWSRPRTKAALEATREAARLMAEGVTLNVPLAVECAVGENWGDCE